MRRHLLAVAFAVAACNSTSPTDHVPQLGRYDFVAEFPVPGFSTPAHVLGNLTITAASPDALTWSLVIVEPTNSTTYAGTASWDASNDYILIGVTAHQAGTWNPIPHLKRIGSAYECRGKAVTNSYPPQPGNIIHNEDMTCSFTFVGQ